MQLNITKVPVTLSLILLSALLLAACSTSAKEYDDLSAAGTKSQKLCFRVEHLPGGFEVIAKYMRDNANAAKDAPDPEQRVRSYSEWGRVIGTFQQWAFEPPSMPDEDADGRMTDEEIERELEKASEELLSASFRSAMCKVDVYSSEAGASDAFRGELQDLKQPHHLADVTVIEVDDVALGEDSAMVVHQFSAPEVVKFIVLMRIDNFIGEMSVSANCNIEDGQDCALVRERAMTVAALLNQRLAEGVRGEPDLEAEAGESNAELSWHDRARRDCSVRDYSGCVDQYVAHAEAGDHVALCRNEYGSWLFEPPTGNVGDLCSDDDYTITAIIGTD